MNFKSIWVTGSYRIGSFWNSIRMKLTQIGPTSKMFYLQLVTRSPRKQLVEVVFGFFWKSTSEMITWTKSTSYLVASRDFVFVCGWRPLNWTNGKRSATLSPLTGLSRISLFCLEKILYAALCNAFFMTLWNNRWVWRLLWRPPADWILISVSDCGVDKFSALFPVQFDRKLDEVYEDLATGEFCLLVCFPYVIGVNNVTIC